MGTSIVFFFTPLVLLFMSEECHDEFFVKFNFFHVECLKMFISKGLGYGIIAGSILVKVPQIVKLIKASSGVGVSIASLFMEMVAIMFNMAYSIHNKFPFSAWGETLFMAVQDAVLVFLIYYYSRSYAAAFLSAPLYGGIAYVLCSSLTPYYVVTKLQEFTLIIASLSKLLQVWSNFSNGHTGQLSFITMMLLSLGSLARVFTSIQETGDLLMASQFVVACSLNAVIMMQMFWYWNVNVVVDKKKKKKAE